MRRGSGPRPLTGVAADGERRVWTPSPGALPILAVRDRVQGWAARRVGSGAPLHSALGGDDRRWIDRVASVAARRLSPGSAGGRIDPRRTALARDNRRPAGEMPTGAADAGDPAVASSPGAASEPHRPALADSWAWPVDGPAAPADVLAQLAARVRPAGQARSNPRPARGASAADLPDPVAPPARSAAARGGEHSRPTLAPSPHPLFRRSPGAPSAAPPAERNASSFPDDEPRSGGGSRAVPHASSAIPRAHGLRALVQAFSRGEAAEVEAPADGAGEGGERGRWDGWPALLPWPRRQPGGTAWPARRTETAAPAAPQSADAPRPARSLADDPPGSAPHEHPAAHPAAAATPRRTAPSAADAPEGSSGDGWLIEALRARSPRPGLAVEPGGATIPVHPAPEADAAGLRGGIPGVVSGAQPLPWLAGAPAADDADPLGELDALAGQVRRILQDEVRRHGIEV